MGAKVEQFDEARAQLTVIGKGNKRRTIDLTPAAPAACRPTALDTEWLFTVQHGGRFTSVANRFYSLCHGRRGANPSNDGIRPFRFHDLRHRFAVDYLKAGGNIYMLQGHLVHTSVKITEGYLAHLSPDEQHRVKFGTGATTKTPTSPKNGRLELSENIN